MDLLAHLEAYVATAEEVSFSRAAERLGIPQPLLSRRVKTLESHFGGRLFDRSRRQVATTQLGVLLLPYARDVLERARRLRQVARSAEQSQPRAVGVPADCAPAALAGVIRAGAERGLCIVLREVPPGERVSGLTDASLAYALLRVAPEHAAFRVPLGLATAPEAQAVVVGRGRAVHLEELRPRRGPTARTPAEPLPLLTLTEDRVPYHDDRLTRAVARAGLPEGLVRQAGPTATAHAETLAGRALLLCTEPFARRHGARWAPFADSALHRGYDIGAAADRPDTAEAPGWLAALLASAAGATPAGSTGPLPGSAGEDVRTRLAAHG